MHTAILTLKEGLEGQITGHNIEIGVVGEDRKFRRAQRRRRPGPGRSAAAKGSLERVREVAARDVVRRLLFPQGAHTSGGC